MHILKDFLLKELLQVIDRINNGSCEMSLEQIELILKIIAHLPLSKEQACKYLNMSRSSFDSKIRSNVFPKGLKRLGFKELVWYKDELDNVVNRE